MILLTGATGHVGRRAAELLAEHGDVLRLAVRDPSKAPQLPRTEVVRADYADPASLDRAFRGVDRALVVSGYAPPGERARLHRNVFEAAARAGVGHLIYLSFQGAAPGSKFPMSVDHHQSEQYLAACGIPFTALRDSFYMDLLPSMFEDSGVLRGPAGQGRVAFVSREDVARTVAGALRRPPPPGEALDVTGPEALTLGEVAQRLSPLVGRTLRYVEETPEEGRAWRGRLGAPAWEVDTWVGSYEAFAAGELEATSDTVERFSARPPLSLEAYFAQQPELLDGLRKVGRR
jgi:uncharacterized protein YbjT (DUF2867 family)